MAEGEPRIKLIAENRKARHDYFFLETFEAGIVLSGPEVKSCRAGRVQLRDAYATVDNGELYLRNAHISPYEQANRMNAPDPRTVRKLLVHKHEIQRLIGKTREKGLTLVPTKFYFKNGRIKVEIAVAKGKQLYDKRETLRRKEADREARQAMLKRV